MARRVLDMRHGNKDCSRDQAQAGMYIAEGASEYIGKHPYGEGATRFWVGMKIMWRGRFFSSQNGLFVLPDLCAGVSRLSDTQTKTEARWSAFSREDKKERRSVSAPVADFLAALLVRLSQKQTV